MTKCLKCLVLFAAAIATSCTHFIADTETRIQIENKTEVPLSNFGVISAGGQQKILVPDTLLPTERSRVYESEFVGDFTLSVFAGDSLINLGNYKLKGGSILGIIRYSPENPSGKKFKIEFK